VSVKRCPMAYEGYHWFSTQVGDEWRCEYCYVTLTDEHKAAGYWAMPYCVIGGHQLSPDGGNTCARCHVELATQKSGEPL
jgi:hypothetical protein